MLLRLIGSQQSRRNRLHHGQLGWVGMTVVAMLCAGSMVAEAQRVREDFYVTNGLVTATALSGNTLYIAGTFTKVGPASGGWVAFDARTASPLKEFPKVAGAVQAAISDGNGGWFIGGNFATVGGIPRHGLAHLLADGSVAAWNPAGSEYFSVNALALSGTTVYVGGQFTSLGGQPRTGLGAVDASTGNATPWNPAVGGNGVADIVVDGARIYVAPYGSRIYAYDLATGLQSWFVEVNYFAEVLALSGNTLYVSGVFTNIGGQARTGIAALDASTGLVTPWNPNADVSQVYALAVSGTTVYAEGAFTRIGGQPRDGLAALDAVTGLATAWNPNLHLALYAAEINGTALAVTATTVYAGTPSGIVALDSASGRLLEWDPRVNGAVSTIAARDGRVYVGGDFTSLGGEVRNHFAALDVRTGIPTPWNPNAEEFASEYPYSLAVSGATVYVAGPFTSIGGVARNGIAAVDATTGLVTPWNPGAGVASTIYVSSIGLATNGETIYVTGFFTSLGGQPRNGLVALDAATGLATAWNPNSDFSQDGNIYELTLMVSGTTVYVAGPFTRIGGQVRNRMAAVDATSGLATVWNPNPEGQTRGYPVALVMGGGVVYAAGDFTSIGGQPRRFLAALDPVTGLATSWNPSASLGGSTFQAVSTIAVSGRTVLVAGARNIGGQSRPTLDAFDAETGLATDWSPSPDLGSVATLAAGGGWVYAGGNFRSMSNLPQSFIAAIEAPNTAPNCSRATAHPSQIFGHEHGFVPVRIGDVTDPDGDRVRIRVTRVTQDEPVVSQRKHDDDDDDDAIDAVAEGGALDLENHGHGNEDRDSKNQCPDARIDRKGNVSLRAERSSHGNGRVYTIWFTASDGRGEPCEGSVQVCVPHDRRHAACVDDGKKYNSLGPCPGRREHDPDAITEVMLSPGTRSGDITTLDYSLPTEGDVSIAVYDVSGRRVAALEHGHESAGEHEVSWNTSGVPRGMYFYRLQAGAVTVTKSVLILR